MATLAIPKCRHKEIQLRKTAAFQDLRVLLWSGDLLYASRKYELLRARITSSTGFIQWEHVAKVDPSRWRTLSCSSRLTARLFRDGFHALAVLPSGCLVGTIPGAIVTLRPGDSEFQITHRVRRGTRPLHLAATPDGAVYWGEYFDNPDRDAVHVYRSVDGGFHWGIAYTFPERSIRHVHNIVYDKWADCLWVLTGDNGSECQILRASCDFGDVEVVLSGSQQARAVALVPRRDALYFSSDTPFETNHIYRLDRRGSLTEVATLSSSSICGCAVGESIFFSTMVEPSTRNPSTTVTVHGSGDGENFVRSISWEKDGWPMGLFQYGNAFFPDGNNDGGTLALTTIAVDKADCESSFWRVDLL